MRRQINAVGGLGNVFRKQGRLYEAMDQYQIQLNLAQSVGDPRSAGMALFHIALCHGLEGDLGRAISVGEESLQALEQVDDLTRNMVGENLEKWKQEVEHS